MICSICLHNRRATVEHVVFLQVMVSSSLGLSFSAVTFGLPVEGIEPVFQLDIRINTATPGSSVYIRDLFIMSCHTPFTTTGKTPVVAEGLSDQDCTLAAVF